MPEPLLCHPKRALRFEQTYPHPPAKIWRVLTTHEHLARWLMHNDFEPKVGHELATFPKCFLRNSDTCTDGKAKLLQRKAAYRAWGMLRIVVTHSSCETVHRLGGDNLG